MFVHLHVHSSYSFLDGYNPVKKLVARVKELGQTACALTDHNNLGGCLEFREECEKRGIKSLLGVEGYYTPDMKEAAKPIDERRQDAIKKAIASGVAEDIIKKTKKKDLAKLLEPYMYDMRQHHILFIAKNKTGWHNLVKIESEAARDCTYNGRFLCDMNLLRKHHEGVICTTACVSSFPARRIQEHHPEEALKYIEDMKEIFGDDFYLEIQPLDIKKQRDVNLQYMEWAKKLNIKVIATNDVHYTRKEDWDDHDTLLCIGTGKKKSDQARMHYSHDFWIKSEDEMYESFENQMDTLEENDLDEDLLDEYNDFYVTAIEETQNVADKVEADYPLGSDHPLFSNVKVPERYGNPTKYFVYLAWKGLYAYLSKHPECDKRTYEERLAYELSIIIPKGFAPYFLAVREYVTWANEHGCMTGPGRGSASGSLVLFSLGITKNIDPIKNNLLFFRFMTKERMELPDIDVDFTYSKRDSVIHHLEDYYGADNVAHIGTYSQLGVKSGLKDVCRVLEVPFMESNHITSQIDEIDNSPKLKFKDLDKMKNSKDESERKSWAKFHELEEKYPEVFRLARAFEGTPRNQGVHASGVLVTPGPVSDYFPIRFKDGTAITLYTGPQVEELGGVKYDVLGLKTLETIQKTIDFIPEIKDVNDLYSKIDLEDPKVWKFIQEKNTEGVFQIESNMMKGLIDDIKPENFNDLVAINALGRPGPLSAGLSHDYALCKNGKKAISYPIHGCDDILNDTFGCITYQEQLMLISKRIAGFSDGQSDSITRKVTAKKKTEMMPMMIRCHTYGKKNCEGPKGWEKDDHAPWYDPKGKYGEEIEGAINKGYDEKEVLQYFKTIEGFSSYAFNRSHAACYAYLAFLTAWLKFYYPVQFMAGTLSMKDDDEIPFYIQAAKKIGIDIDVPNVNVSKNDFTPDAENHRILYGLGSVKGVGAASINDIIKNAPYESLEDALARIPKKAFNKRVAENLIKAGAFDFLGDNRIELLNKLHELRKDRVKNEVTGKNEILQEDPSKWDENKCIEFEDETLGTHLTCHTWWELLEENKGVTFIGKIKSVNEHRQRNGKLMCFVKMENVVSKDEFECCIFASNYGPLNTLFFHREGHLLKVNGKKSDRGSFIINDAQPYKAA